MCLSCLFISFVYSCFSCHFGLPEMATSCLDSLGRPKVYLPALQEAAPMVMDASFETSFGRLGAVLRRFVGCLWGQPPTKKKHTHKQTASVFWGWERISVVVCCSVLQAFSWEIFRFHGVEEVVS